MGLGEIDFHLISQAHTPSSVPVLHSVCVSWAVEVNMFQGPRISPDRILIPTRYSSMYLHFNLFFGFHNSRIGGGALLSWRKFLPRLRVRDLLLLVFHPLI